MEMRQNIGKTIITKLYSDLEKVNEISPSNVHLYLREAINNSKREKNMENSLTSKSPIKTRIYIIEPRTDAQKAYVASLFSNELAFGIGPAGTGKTYLAVAVGVSMFNAVLLKK